MSFRAGIVTIDAGKTKGGKASVFYMTPQLRKLLKKQRTIADALDATTEKPCALVFYRAGKPIEWFYDSWKTACDEANVSGRLLHDLRRTAIRNLVRAGVTEAVSMKMCGHKTRSIFDRYNVSSDNDLRDAASLLGTHHRELVGIKREPERDVPHLWKTAHRASPISLVIACSLMAGCDSIKSSPQLIQADGETYVACRDLVWVTSEGGGLIGGEHTFKVTFTDVVGLSHTIRGVKKIELSDLPKTIQAPMPLNPPTLNPGPAALSQPTDGGGQPYTEGRTYTWPDGSKATVHNGTWEPVQVPNQACSQQK